MKRRDFLKSGAALAGGLMLELSASGVRAAGASAGASGGASSSGTTADGAAFAPNAWVRITPQGEVLLVVHKFDSGTGVKNALGLMLAEELDADWSRVRVVQPDDPLAQVYIHPLWGMHATGGSTSVPLEWNTLRRAGATARAMLVAEAAQRWRVDPASCRTSNGMVIDATGARRLGYGDLAEGAARQPVPTEVALKRPADFVLIGKERSSYRVADKLTGRAQYAVDIKLPGMLTAIVVHPPVINAPVVSFNAAEVKALPGVRDVFATEIPAAIAHFRPGMGPAVPDNGACQPGVAIVADHFWAAQRARQALKVQWGDSDMANFSAEGALRELGRHVDAPGAKSKVKGDAQAAFARADKVVEGVYTMPYKAHAQMEPLSMVAWVHDGIAEYWGGIQVPSRCAQAAQTIAGVPAGKVKIHLTEAGGSFGAREGMHQILEATYISRRVGKPVKLIYSREDDMRGLFYQTASVHKARAALDRDGGIAAFSLRAVTPSIKEPDDPGFLAKVPVDPSCTEAMRDDFYYDIGTLDLAWVRVEPKLPIWWWRAVSYVPNVFAIESLIDEAAHAAGQDPLAYRRRLLRERPEHLAVLERAAALAGWPRASTPGRGLGIATYQGYKSYIAVVAEVEVKESAITVHKLSCVVDCGLAVDPSSVRQQLAGGLYWGVSTAMMNEVPIDHGTVRISNYHDYPVVRITDAPRLEIELMPPSGRAPSGVGELSNPPVVPAIGNAIFAATGKRLRATPFRFA